MDIVSGIWIRKPRPALSIPCFLKIEWHLLTTDNNNTLLLTILLIYPDYKIDKMIFKSNFSLRFHRKDKNDRFSALEKLNRNNFVLNKLLVKKKIRDLININFTVKLKNSYLLLHNNKLHQKRLAKFVKSFTKISQGI